MEVDHIALTFALDSRYLVHVTERLSEPRLFNVVSDVHGVPPASFIIEACLLECQGKEPYSGSCRSVLATHGAGAL